MRTLPPTVNKLAFLHDAWIVSRPVEGEEPRDYDVIVAFSEWRHAAALIPTSAVPNSFGGWKFSEEGKIIDVWPGELAWLMTNNAFMGAWHPKSDRKILRLNPFNTPEAPPVSERATPIGISVERESAVPSVSAPPQTKKKEEK